MSKKTTTMKLTDDLKEKIRNEFVQGIESGTGERKVFSLDELITKYKVAKTTLYRHSKDEGWKMQRERFQEEYLQRLDQERTKNLVGRSKNFDNDSIEVAETLLTTVATELQNNVSQLDKGKGMNPQQVLAFANAALVAQRLAKLALGESTQNVNLNANIKDNSAFARAMELLDEVEDHRRQGESSTTH